MKIDKVERGRVVFSIVADEMHENPMGTMHGGIIATLVDSAMGCAVFSMLPAGTAYSTLELKTNYVRPILQTTGVVRAEVASCTSAGVSRPPRRPSATSTARCTRMPRRPA